MSDAPQSVQPAAGRRPDRRRARSPSPRCCCCSPTAARARQRPRRPRASCCRCRRSASRRWSTWSAVPRDRDRSADPAISATRIWSSSRSSRRARRPRTSPGCSQRRAAAPTLIILPKWVTVPDRRAARLGARARARRRADGGARPGRQAATAGPRPRRGGTAPRRPDILDGLTCRSRASPQMIEGPDADPAGVAARAAARWSRGSASSRIISSPIRTCSTITGSAIPAPARAALALIDGLNATDAGGVDFDLTVNGLGDASGAEPAAHRARAALPGDDPGPGRRRPARRPARRVPLRPGRGARSARSPSARRLWSRTAPA